MDRMPAIRRVILADISPLKAFALSMAAVAVPTALRWAVDQGATGTPFVTYYPFLVLSALMLGWRWAALVTLLSAGIANWLFIEVPLRFFGSPHEALLIALFALSCAALIWTGELARRLVRELEAVQAREALLNGELSHRVKNMLATVSAMAVLTARHSGPEDFAAALTGRLQALQRATDLLTLGENASCELDRLIDTALAPFRAAGNFTIKGPACELPADACVPLALALHELATNAAKYGALSVPGGGVTLVWTIGEGEDRLLRLAWREEGGPPVTPPSKVGMGTQLLRRQRGLKHVKVDFLPGGVECYIQIDRATSQAPVERAA